MAKSEKGTRFKHPEGRRLVKKIEFAISVLSQTIKTLQPTSSNNVR